MDLSHIEHLGIAVRSIQEALPFFEKNLGLTCYNIEEVADQKVRTAFLQIGQTKLELLEPTSEDSPIAKFLEKRGEGIHHIAFATPDTGEALAEMGTNGIQLIDKTPRKGAEGLNIGFLHPKSTHGLLLELCDSKDKNQEPENK
ncbi:MAG: methylmalonyl-CoA epimerase [Bacteroidales bacterium]|nr:methylmalonyl-CoA epimerase [Porphyromonas sp.]MDD6934862.1 methylmalonyl-CoA epimerase [Bacteroidales bacterium]MDY3102227.1 methylmalonyl-CoA epimerase [Porphyromonas sp.]